jgi:carboxymethylenebutenolidase
MMPMVDVPGLESAEQFPAYVAEPSRPPRGAIIVIQEIFGVNPGIRRKCDKWAEQGYLAAAPDLFWRFAKGVELDPDIPDQFQQALKLMGQLDQDKAVADIAATIRFLRGRLPDAGKVGVVGFCLGGRLAYMAAARTDADASVGFYPVGLDNLLGERNAIGKPIMLHVAEEDHFVPKEVQAKVAAGLSGKPHVTIHNYAGEDHGFAAEMGSRRSETSARVAEERTELFFAEHVAGDNSEG